ncbi:MAG TPA: sugar transferase [Candidatus Aquilonibacter sp.]|nr:sugar transferase [Candidatus Aquilonibacter sp.]
MHRMFNVVAAATGLLIFSPVFAVAALAIKRDDGGPVFYAQPRVGQGLRTFRLLKFRSMVCDADRAGLLTAPADPRITRAGRVLRKYKLDELPQLWNVLKGDMQLVGIRPEVRRFVEAYREEFAVLLREPPGITDPASLAYRHEEALLSPECMEEQYLSQILPDKLRLSLNYQQRRNFFSDLVVLLATVLFLPVPKRAAPVLVSQNRRAQT